MMKLGWFVVEGVIGIIALVLILFFTYITSLQICSIYQRMSNDARDGIETTAELIRIGSLKLVPKHS